MLGQLWGGGGGGDATELLMHVMLNPSVTVSENADLTTLETYVQLGKQLTTDSIYMGHNVEKCKQKKGYFFWGGEPGARSFNDQNRHIML